MILKSKDIAKILNVSPSTVSLAINNKPGVSAETKNKVYAVLEEFYASGNFAPDNWQNGDKSEEKEKDGSDIKGNIVLVIHKAEKQLFIPNTFFQGVIDGCQSAAMLNNYILKITYFNTGMSNNMLLDSLSEENVAGVVLYATEIPYDDIKMFKELKKPVVILDARHPFDDMDMITIANRNSIEKAVLYAYEMGHRKIGFLRSHTVIRNFEDRYEGYLSGLRLVGLEFNEKYVFTVHCSLKGAQSDFLEILETPKEELPTIFLTDLDYNVAGALSAIKKKGYSVPDDFSLIGFDDIDLISELDPPLTTIQIKDYFGAIAINRLVDKIEKNDCMHLNIEVSTELLIRESVKRIG